MNGSPTSGVWIAMALCPALSCEQPLTSRPEGVPLAPGEQREALPGWRLRDGLVLETLLDSGHDRSNADDGGASIPTRIDGLGFWEPPARGFAEDWTAEGEPEPGFLWLDHGTQGSWLRVERDEAGDWVLAVSSADRSYSVPRAGTPWGTFWGMSERMRDWSPGESEASAPPISGPAGCRWKSVEFAVAEDGSLPEGTPIVMYALAAGGGGPFKLVTRGSYEAGFRRSDVLALIDDSELQMVSTDRGPGEWVEVACAHAGSAAGGARDLRFERATGRVYFSTAKGVHMLQEGGADRGSSRHFESTLVVARDRGPAGPLVIDSEGGFWFGSGTDLFQSNADGAPPTIAATAPTGSTIVGLGWTADQSALFVALQQGRGRASLVAISAR